jgi:outer membrane protein assembly factor BamB
VTGLPAVQAESVVVVCDGGNLKCYSREGKQLWDYYARGRLTPYVTRSREGTSYICRTDGTLIAVNRSGRELWRIGLGAPLSAPVLSGWDGRIFAAAGTSLSCYNAAGYRLWTRVQGVPAAAVPDTRGGLVMALEKELVTVDAFGRAVSRELRETPRIIAPLADGSALVFYESGAAELIGGKAGPTALPAFPGVPLAAASRFDKAALAFAGGRVLLFSGSEGKILWAGESHIGAAEETGMLYDERGVYVLSKSGAAGFTEDGRRLWILRLSGSAALPAFSDEGILYSGGADWILYAFKLEDRVRNQGRSLYGPAPPGSYGLGNPPPSPWADYHYRFEERELQTQLALIAQAVREGRIGDRETAYVGYLMETAGRASPDTAGPGPGSGPPIRERAEAIRLLGYLGSRETVPFLANLFYRDREILVKAAAAEAIGRIGVDPEGTAIRVFTWAIASPFQDEQVLAAAARATGALCRFSGPPLSDTGVRLLSALTAGDRPAAVRREAQRELASLRP